MIYNGHEERTLHSSLSILKDIAGYIARKILKLFVITTAALSRAFREDYFLFIC